LTCYCQDCAITPRDTYSEEFRHACEAREIAKRKGSEIKLYLEGIEQKRGIDARVKLRKDILQIREK
jgi:hypothetical protein